jgi:hypothetical protein
VFYPSLADADVVDLEFLKSDGNARSLRLLVDSGFVGRSSVVLPHDAADLIRANLPASHTTGALQGLLTFLRQFARWGAQRTVRGWEFFLSDTSD